MRIFNVYHMYAVPMTTKKGNREPEAGVTEL